MKKGLRNIFKTLFQKLTELTEVENQKNEPTKKCEHEWYYAGLVTVGTYNGREPQYRDKTNIFCPKCKGERIVSKQEWDKIDKQQEIMSAHKAITGNVRLGGNSDKNAQRRIRND